jgi:type IX secretion system PorP/SprF family membrane protein
MKSSLLTVAAFVLFAISSQAQSFSNYYYDYKLLNPAFVGNQDKHIITTVYSGFPSMRYSSMFYGSYETSIPKIKSGVGAMVYNQNFGVLNYLGGGIFYNKQFQFNEHSGLRVGTQLHYRRREIDYERDGEYYDVAFEGRVITGLNLDLGVLYYSRVLNIGVGVNDFFKQEEVSNTRWNLSVSREFKVANALEISPAIVVVWDQYRNIYRFDANTIIEIKQWIILGAGYLVWNGGDALNVSAGINVKDWVQVIGHVYSSSNDYFREYNDGQVEVIVRANIPHKKKSE